MNRYKLTFPTYEPSVENAQKLYRALKAVFGDQCELIASTSDDGPLMFVIVQETDVVIDVWVQNEKVN